MRRNRRTPPTYGEEPIGARFAWRKIHVSRTGSSKTETDGRRSGGLFNRWMRWTDTRQPGEEKTLTTPKPTRRRMVGLCWSLAFTVASLLPCWGWCGLRPSIPKACKAGRRGMRRGGSYGRDWKRAKRKGRGHGKAFEKVDEWKTISHATRNGWASVSASLP